MPGNTFPINKDDLPTLKTRRALLVIDLQNDFLSEGAPLHTAKPEGLVSRISSLVAAFRQTGDILWVRSEYKVKRIHQEDDIVVSDTPLMPLAARSRRKIPAQQPAAISDPEAFLSIDGPKKSLAVRTGTPGADFYSAIDPSIDKTRDRCFTKSHYSAFQSGELIKLLRTRFVTELFLVGSLVNVGVFATAVDAASHGYEITIVEDCCGFRSAARQENALRRVVELTGCDVVPASDVVVNLKPKVEEPNQAKLLDAKPTSQAADAAEQDALSSGLQKLNLENDDEGKSGEGVAGKAQSDKSPDAGTPSIQPQTDEDNSSKTFDKSPSDEKLDSEKNTSAHDDSNNGGAESQEIGTIIRKKVPAEQTAVDQKDIKQFQADIRDTTPPSSTLQAKSTPNTIQPTPNTTQPTPDTTKSTLGTTQPIPDTPKSTPGTTQPTPGTTKPTPDTTKPTPDTTEPSESEDISTTTKPPVPEVKSQQKIATVPMKARLETPEPICEGDTSLVRNILPIDQADEIFEKLKSEVEWAHMSHQGGEVPRLVAVQGEVADDGSQPVYRHPSDESPPLHPFSPTVRFIKEKVEKELNHPLNHVLIQWYRNGHDYINEHSDKTLDIVPGSYITNVSLGAQRTMVLRTKRNHDNAATESPKPADLKRNTVRVPLSHNSLFRMGLKTNEKWLHGIRQDRRLDREKTEPELAFDSARISLTFRHIGTFMDAEGKLIWGQGATSKTKEGAKQVINGQTPEAIKMLQGFGTENHSSIFDWQKHYGSGFDVLHISASPRLFASSDEIVNHRVQFMLAELGINYARGSVASGSVEEEAKPEGTQIKFVDNDDEQSVVLGEAAIILYLELVYNKDRCTRSNAQLSKELSRFNLAFELLRWFRALEDKNENQGRKVKKALSAWNNYVTEEEQGFAGGKTITIVDYAFFPALHHIREVMGKKVLVGGLEGLEKYYTTVRCRASLVKVMGPTEDEDAEKVVGEVRDKCSDNKEDGKNKSTMEEAVDDLSDLVKSRLVM